MKTTQSNFDNFAQDAQKYTNEVAEALGHPDENKRSLILWRAVLHTVRDRIHIGEALDLIGPLPMIFKGIYVEGWKYSETPTLDFESMEAMKNQVKKRQRQNGEQDFDWAKSTEDLITITLNSLSRFMPESQLKHILGQMPEEVKETLEKKVAL